MGTSSNRVGAGGRQLAGLAYFAETGEAAHTELCRHMHILQHDAHYMGAPMQLQDLTSLLPPSQQCPRMTE